MRSWLLAACAHEADLKAALESGADFVILDLDRSPRAVD